MVACDAPRTTLPRRSSRLISSCNTNNGWLPWGGVIVRHSVILPQVGIAYIGTYLIHLLLKWCTIQAVFLKIDLVSIFLMRTKEVFLQLYCTTKRLYIYSLFKIGKYRYMYYLVCRWPIEHHAAHTELNPWHGGHGHDGAVKGRKCCDGLQSQHTTSNHYSSVKPSTLWKFLSQCWFK